MVVDIKISKLTDAEFRAKCGKHGIEPASDEECEACDYAVCMPVGPSRFDDNLTGACCECGCAIMFRPHVPKRPKKICLSCMLKVAT